MRLRRHQPALNANLTDLTFRVPARSRRTVSAGEGEVSPFVGETVLACTPRLGDSAYAGYPYDRDYVVSCTFTMLWTKEIVIAYSENSCASGGARSCQRPHAEAARLLPSLYVPGTLTRYPASRTASRRVLFIPLHAQATCTLTLTSSTDLSQRHKLSESLS